MRCWIDVLMVLHFLVWVVAAVVGRLNKSSCREKSSSFEWWSGPRRCFWRRRSCWRRRRRLTFSVSGAFSIISPLFFDLKKKLLFCLGLFISTCPPPPTPFYHSFAVEIDIQIVIHSRWPHVTLTWLTFFFFKLIKKKKKMDDRWIHFIRAPVRSGVLRSSLTASSTSSWASSMTPSAGRSTVDLSFDLLFIFKKKHKQRFYVCSAELIKSKKKKKKKKRCWNRWNCFDASFFQWSDFPLRFVPLKSQFQ